MSRNESRYALIFLALAAAVAMLATLIPARCGYAGELEARVKAAYIFNFTKFMEWPDSGGSGAAEPIRICIIGNDPLRTILGELTNREVKGHPLKVVKIRDIREAGACNLLFVSRSEEPQVARILQQLQGTRTITVSDINQFSQRGGGIGFVTDKERVKIEISQKAVRQSGVKISAKLFEIARMMP